MADPQAYSLDQLLSEALDTYISKTGVNDLNEGGVSVGFFEANAQMTFRATASVFQILRDRSLDRATGDTLDRIGAEEGVARISASPSYGNVNIADSSFVKQASKIYAGARALNVGSTQVPVSDATGWPASGSVYIGRSTPNVEGPLAYSSITPTGGYFVINLVNPTVKFHNVSESVIVAQGGNRTVQANTTVTAPSAGGAADVKFSTNDSVVILDGENLATGILVTAQLPGTSGQVVRGAIRAFQGSAPFTGATVTNPNRFSTGSAQETDDDYRARIKQARQSRGLGTPTAIQNAVQGASAPDETAIATQPQILTSGGKTTLYVDDGSGYERKTAGVGLEFIVDSALGGETDFTLARGGTQAGVAKAFLLSGNSTPFALNGGEKLNILVGGVLSEHVFAASDFQAPGAATAYEIVASINGDSNLSFNAATATNGTQFYIIAKTETFEFLQISVPTSGVDAAPLCGFQSNEVDTLRLYKNNQPLSKDGIDAFVISANQSDWSNTIAANDTLILSVDGTAAITYTITNQDFINDGTFALVSATNTLQSWVDVFNAKLTGVTASIEGTAIKLQSNLGPNERASVVIDPSSTLVSKGMFTTTIGLSATGKSQDYQFSRNTGQIKLLTPLATGDSLTAGSSNTAAMVTGADIVGSTAVFANDGFMWVLVDDPDAQTINTKVASGTTISVTKPSTNVIRYTSNVSNAFANCLVGDYVIIWSTELDATTRLEGRIYAVTATTLDIKVTAMEYAAAVVQSNVSFQRGFNVVRTTEVPQKIKIAAGTYNINDLADDLTAVLVGATVTVEEDLRLIVSTDTLTEGEGAVMIVTFDTNATPAGFTEGDQDVSRISHTATYETTAQLGDYPLFVHTKFTSEDSKNPPISYIANLSTDQDFSSYDPNFLVKFLNAYSQPSDALSAPNQIVQLDDIGSSNITMEQSNFVRRLRIGDRAYLAYPLMFGPNDQMVVILDDDTAEKTFTVPLYRRAITNTTNVNNANTFNAYDEDGGPTTAFTQYFGTSFDFSDFQVLMQAKKVYKAVAAQTAILYRAAVWGRAGERYAVSYVYPTSPNQAISSVVSTDSTTLIAISLASGAPITTQIDGTTTWNVTITPNTPSAGIDQVTYSWSGTGTNPNLAALVGGEYVTIGANSQFDPRNTGTFRVSTQAGFLPTSTSFTVQRANGTAVAQSGAATLVNSSIQFFASSPTTAAQVAAYVNANLTDWVTATLVNDGGSSGSGVIALSTQEQKSFSTDRVPLQDGLNWISTSNISGSPQFSLKRALTLPSDVGYAFNAGEEIRLTPTTMEQTSRFLNVLAVTGLTTLSKVDTSIRDRRLQITTDTLGSGGAVQVIGGSASIQSAQAVGSSFESDLTYAKTIALRSQASNLLAGQLVRLQAANAQQKDAGFSATTGVTITPNNPSAGQTLITLSNRQTNQRYFGSPRSGLNVGSNGWRVERHGKLVCVSWNGSGTTPTFSRSANFNTTGGGTMYVYAIPGTPTMQIQLTSGTGTFADVNIGDLITISGLSYYGNNGTFEITGKSDDNLTLQVENENAQSGTITSTITVTSYASLSGQSFTVGTVTKTEGTDWSAATSNNATAASLGAALATIAGVTVNVVNNVITLTETYAGANVPVTTTAGGGYTISNNPMVGQSYADGDFVATIGVQEGDTVIMGTAFNVLNRGTYRVIRTFNNSYWIENDNAVQEEVSISSSDMVFYEYEATVPGDQIGITANLLNVLNLGTYTIAQVIDKNNVVIDQILTSVPFTVLGAAFSGFYVQEGIKYYGYKTIYNIAVDASNDQQMDIIFDTRFQADRINDTGVVTITGLGKLDFSTVLKTGLDSYRYDIGLLAEANRIVYGDPRDKVTYPGVAAAGAEIYTDPPFFRRVTLGIDVRVLTGVPFSQITEQVRDAVQSLIDSSPIGQSIPISSIVSAVNSIPGVFAVAISSPLYNASNDLITIQPSEKALIIDQTSDIAVSQIGS